MPEQPRERLDPWEEAVRFALERALRRDREEAAKRTMRIVQGGKRGGQAA